MTKRIPLTQNKEALVDDDDYERLARFKWTAFRPYRTYYAVRWVGKGKQKRGVYMHREILGAKSRNEKVDHQNGNGLDNRRKNLRIATHSQNLYNRGRPKQNTSGFKGVSWDTKTGKWVAQLWFDKRRLVLGYFTNKLKAANAYKNKARELHGEFYHP
jgi:hypothetical protein